MREISVNSSPKNISKIRNVIKNELSEFNSYDINNIFLVTEEIFSNIINHGYGNDLGEVKIAVDIDDKNNAVITFIDSGKEYNILEHNMPNVNLSLEDRECGGLGIFLIRKISDKIIYKSIEGKNYLTVFFNPNK